MWLFYSYTNGYIPMGSDGQMKVPSSTRSMKSIQKLATAFLGKRAGSVYLMRSWTQAMCELGPRAFEEYILHNGEKVAHS